MFRAIARPAAPARRRRPTLITRMLHLMAIARSRRQLARLDARLLADIGLTRAAAEAEATRPAWNPPGHWRL